MGGLLCTNNNRLQNSTHQNAPLDPDYRGHEMSSRDVFKVVQTELGPEELQYIIDVSRHDFETDEDLISEFKKIEARLKDGQGY